jgi:hypothetical protein
VPKQTYKITAFHGGINSNSDPRDINEYESVSLYDINIDKVGKLSTVGTISSTATSNTLTILPNRGLYVLDSDRKLDGSSANETIIFNYDTNDTNIDAKDSAGWGTDKITFGGAISPVYYSADGVVRVSDAAFSQDSQWFGYIEDQRFASLNAVGPSAAWVNVDQSLSKPTVGKCLISTAYEGTETNGIDSANAEYIGTAIDGAVDLGVPDVVEPASVNLRVGIQYSELQPDLAANWAYVQATGVNVGASTNLYKYPYQFLKNQVKVITSGNAYYSHISDSGLNYTIDDSTNFAIAIFITSGREYNKLDKVHVDCGTGSGNYTWAVNKNDIVPDCWNLIVCAKDTYDSIASTPPDWGDDFTAWGMFVYQSSTESGNASPTFFASAPLVTDAALDGFQPGVYTFHYTWLYDAERKQESLPFQFGDISPELTGTHTGGDSDTDMIDSAASFGPNDNLIGRLIQNITDGSEGFIDDSTNTTADASDLLYGSDNSWDTADDDAYKINAVNVNKVVILKNPCLFRFDTYMCTNNLAGDAYSLDKRISGARLYWKVEENDNYFLIGELDFINKGFKWTTDADIVAYDAVNTSDATAPILSKTSIIKNISPSSSNNVDTFKNINGFSTEVLSIDAQYKTAVVQGRRAYIGNIKQNGKTHPDRILKSQVNRFDTFPEGLGSVDVVIRDGENIVKLETFADRILQFKENSLYIINVSENVDFLEDTYRNKGCAYPYHVTKTDYGIAWFNIHGVYFYDGKQVSNLLERNNIRLINEEDWGTFITGVFTDATCDYNNDPTIDHDDDDGRIKADLSVTGTNIPASSTVDSVASDTSFELSASTAGGVHTNSTLTFTDSNMYYSHIGYIPKKRQLLILTASHEYHIYDFVLQSWFKGRIIRSNQTTMTNFALDSDQDLFFLSGTASDIMKWAPSPASSKNFGLQTKDIDFGEPGVRKKIYRVYITYKSGGTTNVQVKYDTNGHTDFDLTFADGDNFASDELAYDSGNANKWIQATLKPSTSSQANNIYSFALKFTTDGTVPSTFEINDITIVYRMKNIR